MPATKTYVAAWGCLLISFMTGGTVVSGIAAILAVCFLLADKFGY